MIFLYDLLRIFSFFHLWGLSKMYYSLLKYFIIKNYLLSVIYIDIKNMVYLLYILL